MYLLWQAHKQLLDPVNYAGIESGLTWLGVAGLIDPPRPEVKGAIEDCVRAGIRVRMLRCIPCRTCNIPLSVSMMRAITQ